MSVDTSWRGVIKAGGLSLLAGGIIFFTFILSVFIFQVQLPLVRLQFFLPKMSFLVFQQSKGW